MSRRLFAAAAAALVAAACPFAAEAHAAGADQVVQVQGGTVRCLLSADYQGRGRARAICGHSDGSPFGSSPMSTEKYPEKLNLVVVQEGGEQWWEAGTIPGAPEQDVVVPVGQTYSANGWTVTDQELRAVVENDLSKHGLIVNFVNPRLF
ncbi:hypothetical protein Mycch_4355 [Mycolicibacterium chubuense NBB4]|uniref:Uncharacterized protein n=1 Tax=Mycolicibacterium chubuense (strain NBB4) TaxID=710421 RepID=I4BP58_MYCCN|nr:hypothetical protein [Mycolicibacterium chubuense]AFM19065.1 hypothetical protein Mycch_4355 [Mycolicibacterium chubuense NBB4]